MPLIKKAVTDDPSLLLPTGAHSLETRMRRLVYEPFKCYASSQVSASSPTTLKPYLIVIDGLDECTDHDQAEEFMVGLLSFFEDNPTIPLRFLIASRVEEHIYRHLQGESVSLENLSDQGSEEDIKLFLRTFFTKEAKTNRVIRSYGQWPSDEDLRKLVEHVDGSFIFASTFAKYILGHIDEDVRLEGSAVGRIQPRGDGLTPIERLRLALNIDPGLDGLYSQILSRSQHLDLFPHILLAINTLALSIKDLARNLACPPHQVTEVLVNLQAIIQVPGNDDSYIRFFHSSLRDFLEDSGRSREFSHDTLMAALLTRAERLRPQLLHDVALSSTFITQIEGDIPLDSCHRWLPGAGPQTDRVPDRLPWHDLCPFVYQERDGKVYIHYPFLYFLKEAKRSGRFHIPRDQAQRNIMDQVKLNTHWKAILTTLSLLLSADDPTVSTLAMWSGVDISEVESVLHALRPVVAPDDWNTGDTSRLSRFLEECGECDTSTEALESVFGRVLAASRDVPGHWAVLRAVACPWDVERRRLDAFRQTVVHGEISDMAFRTKQDARSLLKVLKVLDPLVYYIPGNSKVYSNRKFSEYLSSTIR